MFCYHENELVDFDFVTGQMQKDEIGVLVHKLKPNADL